MSPWKDEDMATLPLMQEYLKEFREGIENNSECKLSPQESARVQKSIKATENFAENMLKNRKSQLYMHDLILMIVGFYGGYLTALDSFPNPGTVQAN
jgi:hypothetical protein